MHLYENSIMSKSGASFLLPIQYSNMIFFIRQSQSQLIIRKVIAVFHILADLQQNLTKRIRRLFFYHIADLFIGFFRQ